MPKALDPSACTAVVWRHSGCIRRICRCLSRKTIRPRSRLDSTSPMSFAHCVVADVQWKPNPFVFDINIRTSTGQKVMKRILLDTGSDLNLISTSAYQDVLCPIRRTQHSVRSLAGQTSIVGETTLSWVFLVSSDLDSVEIPPQAESFSVLASAESAAFDCILGHGWILSHLEIFSALVRSKRRSVFSTVLCVQPSDRVG